MGKIILSLLVIQLISHLSFSQEDQEKAAVFKSYYSAPIGTVIAYAGSKENFDVYLGSRFLICDGRLISKTDFSLLYAVTGTLWGGTGTPSFKIPDLRGRFLRGADLGSGNDPDSNTRTDLEGSDVSNPDRSGTYQSDAFQGHWHTGYHNKSGSPSATITQAFQNGISKQENNTITSGGTPRSDGKNGKTRISKETRPINASVIFIIRAK